MPSAAPGFPSRAEVLDGYARRSGIDPGDFRFYRVLSVFRLAIVFRQLFKPPSARCAHEPGVRPLRRPRRRTSRPRSRDHRPAAGLSACRATLFPAVPSTRVLPDLTLDEPRMIAFTGATAFVAGLVRGFSGFGGPALMALVLTQFLQPAVGADQGGDHRRGVVSAARAEHCTRVQPARHCDRHSRNPRRAPHRDIPAGGDGLSVGAEGARLPVCGRRVRRRHAARGPLSSVAVWSRSTSRWGCSRGSCSVRPTSRSSP